MSPPRRLGVALVGLGLLGGCGARAVCVDDSMSATLQSEPVSDSVIMTDAGDQVELALTARLTGLPELWAGDDSVIWGGWTLSVTPKYLDDSSGSEGAVQLPQIRVTITRTQTGTVATGTTSSLSSGGTDFEIGDFEACWGEDDKHCCPVGESECVLPVTIQLERLDGTDYAPVTVQWSVSANAHVETCPLGSDNVALSVAQEAP